MVKYKYILDSIEVYIEKCSDGTDIPRAVTKQFERFTEKYGKLTDHEEVSVYDDNGNEVYHNVGNAHSVKTDIMSLIDSGYVENLNSIHNHPSSTDPKYALIPTYFSEADINKLLILGDGDGLYSYLFHSTTCCGSNGYRMTLIRGKDFTDGDEANYVNAGQYLVDNCRDYYSKYSSALKKNAILRADEYRESKDWKGVSEVKVEDFYKQAHEDTIKELGTMEQYLKKNGVYDGFKNAHCKLRIIKSKD